VICLESPLLKGYPTLVGIEGLFRQRTATALQEDGDPREDGRHQIRWHLKALACLMMMMMMTFITQRGKSQGKTKKERKATKSKPAFKEAMTKWSDAKGFSWALDGGNCICAMFQAASATAAKKSQSLGRGTILLDITAYKEADIKT
jgi:hypothetical protein